jgi:hypothetical protein
MSEERMIMNTFWGALAIATFTLILLVIPWDREERVSQQELYCEMVALSIETNGDLGWPDFRNTYRKVCVA